LKNVAYFSLSKNDVFLTTFTTQSTTFSPAKNHVQPPRFSKTPLKNLSKNSKTPGLPGPFFFFNKIQI